MHYILGEDMWKLFWLSFVFCLQRSVVVSLTLCNTAWNYLEVKEDSNNNIFTCTELAATETVYWTWKTNNQDQPISRCLPLPSTCSESFIKRFRATRTSDTASIITIDARNISDSSLFGTTSLICEAPTKITCQLDSVYPAENSRCQVYFNGNTWQVTVSCSVSKARSARNNYRCFLYQVPEVSQATSLGSYSMDVVQGQFGYVSGTCNMTSYLPPEGRYSYYVIIMPGEVNVSATFVGNNTISLPRLKPNHNCPLYSNEGDTISCSCFVSDAGNPPGILRWNNTSSNKLEYKNLQKSQTGIQSVCTLTWNNTVKQSVSYTLIVTYRPTSVRFLMNDKSDNVSVVENSTITMRCEADGRPAPRMTITKASDNSVLKTTSEGNITVEDQKGEITYTVTEAWCSHTDKYICTAANGIGMKDQSVSLFVKCTPRRVNASPTPPTIVEGKSTSFELIAYPNSVTVTKYFMGSNNCSCETPASDEIFGVVCSPNPQLPYKVTCTVTIITVTVNTAGLYKAVVSNDLGSVALIFEALAQNTTGNAKNEDVTSSEFNRGHKVGLGTGLGIGLGVAAAEAVVVATVVLVFCWRRKQRTLKAKGRRENTSLRQDISFNKAEEPTLSSGKEHEGAYESIGNNETGQTPAYTNVQGNHLSSRKTSNKTGNVYDGLYLQDVGVSSPYASIQ